MFEIVHQESVKLYLHMYNENVQQNPLCAASYVTKGNPISPRFSLTFFNCDVNSVLYGSAQFLYTRVQIDALEIKIVSVLNGTAT